MDFINHLWRERSLNQSSCKSQNAKNNNRLIVQHQSDTSCFNTPNRDNFYNCYKNSTLSDQVVLGKGSFGVVLKAEYHERNVAVKILDKTKSIKYNSIKNEANVMKLLHKNIIQVFKIVDGLKYGAVVMEYCLNGFCLSDLLAEKCRIDLVHKLWILSDLASAISFCHQNHIIHSDVKPQNILIAIVDCKPTRCYICKLFDFGCSFKFDSEGTECKDCRGTIHYMPPEMLQGLEVSPAIDVYSFAIVMWQLNNKNPYEDLKDNDIIAYNVVKNQLRPDVVINVGDDNSFEDELLLCQTSSKREYSQAQYHSEEFSPFYCSKLPSEVQLELTPIFYRHQNPSSKESTPGKLKLNKLSNKKLSLHRKQLFSCKNINRREPKDNVRSFLHLFLDSEAEDIPMSKVLVVEAEYVKLYKNCWQQVPGARPKSQTVVKLIEKLLEDLH